MLEDPRPENAANDTLRRLESMVSHVKSKKEVSLEFMKSREYEQMIREITDASTLHEQAAEYISDSKKKPGEFTLEDYYALPEERRVELIDGVFYDMASPTVEHQLLVGSVYGQLQGYIKRKGSRCLPLLSPVDVKLDKDDKTIVQPDIIVVRNRGQVQEQIVSGGPDLVIEVVSPSSVSRDYIQKTAKYMAAGVREYWIIDPLRQRVLTYDFSVNASPVIYPLTEKIPVAICHGELSINLDNYRDLL